MSEIASITTSESRPALVVETTGAIAVIRFNRPAQRNPLSTTTLDQLDESLTEIFASTQIDAIVFTGTDNVFAAGADIRELSALNQAAAKAFSERGQKLFQRIADARELTIAAINGFCIGGALDLALACDFRIASVSASFAHPGARLGIITGWGGTQRLPRLIGRIRAIEFFATARTYSANEALELGLVTEIADAAIDRALELAAIHVSRINKGADRKNGASVSLPTDN